MCSVRTISREVPLCGIPQRLYARLPANGGVEDIVRTPMRVGESGRNDLTLLQKMVQLVPPINRGQSEQVYHKAEE